MANKVKPTAADTGGFFAAPFASPEGLSAVNAAMAQAAERGVTVWLKAEIWEGACSGAGRKNHESGRQAPLAAGL